MVGINRKKIIFLIIILLLFISIGSFFVYYKNKKIKDSRLKQDSKIDQINDLDELKRQGEINKKEYDLAGKARKEGKIKYCFQLTKSDPDNCIYNAAVLRNDIKFCEEIKKQELKTKCQESFLYAGIIAQDDASKCDSLSDKELNKQCFSEFFWKWDDVEKCDNIKEELKVQCQDIIYKKTAYNSGDVQNCAKINSEILKKDCAETIANKPKDSDSDGIIDSMEMSYGTDPFKADTDEDGLSDLDELSKYFTNPKIADTDGDGFSDGDEVKKGFNPKGEGKIEK